MLLGLLFTVLILALPGLGALLALYLHQRQIDRWY